MAQKGKLTDSEKEKTKLLAVYLNGIALAMVSFGFAAPLIAALYGAVNSPPMGEVLLWGPAWLFGSITMHYTAAGVLEDLDV